MISGRSRPEILKGTRGRAAREAGRENRCARDVEASAQLDPTGYLPSEIKKAPTLRDQVSAFDRHHEHELKPGKAHSLSARSATFTLRARRNARTKHDRTGGTA